MMPFLTEITLLCVGAMIVVAAMSAPKPKKIRVPARKETK